MKLFLILLIVSLTSATRLDDCSDKCTEGNNKEPCVKGCQYAHALTLSPESPANRNLCQKACEDNLKNNDVQACSAGCDAFDKTKDLFGPFHLLDMVRGLFSHLFPGKINEPAPVQPEQDIESGPITVSRIRIFIPLGSEDNQPPVAQPVQPEPVEDEDRMPHMMMHGMPHHMMVIRRPAAESKSAQFGENIGCWFRRAIHAPFLLILFIVTLSTLFILLFVQLMVLIRRRRSAARGYLYAPLPTYAEATNMKVPLNDDNDEAKKPLNQLEPEA